MVSATALSRKQQGAFAAPAKSKPVVGAQVAQLIADCWMNVSSTESALADLASMQSGIVMWRAAPTMQSIMAAMAGPVLKSTDRILCAGFQSYPWQVASGVPMQSVLCQYIGKNFPTNVLSLSAEDIAGALSKKTKSGMTLVAMHIESDKGWKDVRAISAAAVKSETPILMLISSSVPAPAAAMLETLVPSVTDQWHNAADQVQTAAAQVRNAGAIRVIACLDDVSSAAAESATMSAAGWTPIEWKGVMKDIREKGERAMWQSLRAPCETF